MRKRDRIALDIHAELKLNEQELENLQVLLASDERGSCFVNPAYMEETAQALRTLADRLDKLAERQWERTEPPPKGRNRDQEKNLLFAERYGRTKT